MKNEKLLERKSAVYQMGLLFNQQPNDEKITAYANALMNYEPKQIIFAFNKVIASGSAFFPSMAEILVHLKPKSISSVNTGNEVANELFDKILEYGRYKSGLFEALSPVAKEILENNRYLFLEILDSEKHQVPTIRAQIRDLVTASQEGAKAQTHNESLQRIGIDVSGKVLTMKRPELKTMDFSGYLPTEGA